MKERVAEALRKARDLMNDSGAHWTRYDLRTRAYDDQEGEWLDEYSYCSLGAIYAATGIDLDKIISFDSDQGYIYAEEEESREVLATGDPELRAAVIESLVEQIDRAEIPEPYKGHWYEQATDVERQKLRITNWNDDHVQDWSEVEAMFEEAARAVEENGKVIPE
jgi:hypothetical protein